jgi:hypothetical protein
MPQPGTALAFARPIVSSLSSGVVLSRVSLQGVISRLPRAAL